MCYIMQTLSRLSVGFRTHLKSTQFHFILFPVVRDFVDQSSIIVCRAVFLIVLSLLTCST